jgi:hypothetical protein
MSYIAENTAHKTVADDIENLSWAFITDGVMTRKQLGKYIVELRGSWLTALYLYQDFKRATGLYDPPKVAFVRYRRYKDSYKRMSHFNFSLGQMADGMPVLAHWAKFGKLIADEKDVPILPSFVPEDDALD